eukprot:577637-Prymnesium_polylepis.1
MRARSLRCTSGRAARSICPASTRSSSATESSRSSRSSSSRSRRTSHPSSSCPTSSWRRRPS